MIPPGVDLRQLRYYVTLSEELHFRRAAEKLHISQPPLSQAIRRLEESLGVQLLRRTSREVTPTEAGRVFAEEARKVIATLEVAVAETRRAGGAGATLRIGCAPHLPIDGLLRLRALMEARGLKLETEVTYLRTIEQLRRLRIGELDLGIFNYAEDHEDLDQEPLFAGEELAVWLAPDHALASKEVLGPDDLREEDLVVPPRSINPALVDSFFAQIEASGYRFRQVLEAGGTDVRDVVLAVATGTGVSFLPSSIKEATGAGPIISRRKLDPPLSLPDVVIAWRRDAPRQLAAVLAVAREAARELRHASGEEAAAAS